jgi:DNA modification methylase
MIERIVKASSNKGDIVLDCFVGSGTTAVAAKKLNRRYLASDSNSEFVKITRKRIKKLNI